MSEKLLEIKDLYVNTEDKDILKGIDLKINKGEIHVIMGPNGSGKTTTANAILNNPRYMKPQGTIEFDGEDITNLKTDERTREVAVIVKSCRSNYRRKYQEYLLQIS